MKPFRQVGLQSDDPAHRENSAVGLQPGLHGTNDHAEQRPAGLHFRRRVINPMGPGSRGRGTCTR